jgi:hypothetical protein
MHFKGTVLEVVDWMLLADDRDKWWAFVNSVMNLDVSLISQLF